jgi:hypothetical protein
MIIFRYCGSKAPKFTNTAYEKGRPRWLVIFNGSIGTLNQVFLNPERSRKTRKLKIRGFCLLAD